MISARQVRFISALMAFSIASILFASCDRGAPVPIDEPATVVVDIGEDSALSARATSDATLAQAFSSQATSLQVLVRGTVTKVLSDDVSGDKHQRFIVKLSNGQTLLVAHNIDIAPRVPNIKANTIVYAYGEYEWNAEGGVVHWTHRDPSGAHKAGWIQYFGETYQ
jgi:hypothetical protein